MTDYLSSEYMLIDTHGKYIRVYALEDCLAAIRLRNERAEETLRQLKEENRCLKEEAYKDSELQRMKDELERIKADCRRGFSISEREAIAIDNWIKKHDKDVHGLMTDYDRQSAGGCIGGRFTYHFIPTGLGVMGTVQCSCGAEFQFQKIDL